MSVSMSEPLSHTSESNASLLCSFLSNHIGVSGIKYKNITRRAGETPPIRASNFQWQKTPATKDITRPVTMANVLIEPSMPRVRGCAISAMYTFRTTEIHSKEPQFKFLRMLLFPQKKTFAGIPSGSKLLRKLQFTVLVHLQNNK